MTPAHSYHAARFAGRCGSCASDVIHGDTVLTIHGRPRRTLCKPCAGQWLMRQAHNTESARQASALAKRDPPE